MDYVRIKDYMPHEFFLMYFSKFLLKFRIIKTVTNFL